MTLQEANQTIAEYMGEDGFHKHPTGIDPYAGMWKMEDNPKDFISLDSLITVWEKLGISEIIGSRYCDGEWIFEIRKFSTGKVIEGLNRESLQKAAAIATAKAIKDNS